MLKKTTASVSSLLSVITAAIATVTISLPAKAADFRPYRFVSGQESIRLDADALNSLEAIGLTLSSVDNLVSPATGFDFGWPVVPPATTPGDRGTSFEFLYDEDTDTFVPISGTIEFNGSFFFDLDPTKFSLASPLELGELSVFFNEKFEFFATDTVTTNLPIMSVNTFEAPTIDLENRTWFLEPLELVFTPEFSDFLINAAITQESANQVASLIPGLKVGEARGDRGFIPLNTASVPEPSSLLAIFMVTGTALVARKKY
jgi:hypothetical protein